MKADSLYGSRISLISKSQIRYLGILHEINEEESTVSLKNVRSMGTEGRLGKPEEEIATSDRVYDFIQFRAADVIDIRLEAPAEPAEKQAAPQVPSDPAILEASVSSHPAGQQAPAPSATVPTPGPTHPQYLAPAAGAAAAYYSPSNVPSHQPQPSYQENVDQQNGATRPVAENVENGQTIPHGHGPGPQEGAWRGRGRGYRRRPSGYRYNNQPRMVIPKSDFDFESSNAKFSKDDLLKEFVKLNVQDGPSTSEGPVTQPAEEKAPTPSQTTKSKELEVVIPPPQAFYNKKASFFDDISCEIKERMASASTPLPFDERRHRIQEERRLNVETFGQAQSHRYNRYGNRGGHGYRQDGRGRGYRGRGRGRGRGGYYSNQNYNQPPPVNQ